MKQQTGRQGSRIHPIRTTKRKKNFKKDEESLRDLWDNMKRKNIEIIGVPEREDRNEKYNNLNEEYTRKIQQ